MKQEGEKLNGTFSAANKKGELQKITGTVNGDKVVFSWELKPPPEIKKPGFTVVFNGTLVSPTKIAGVIRNPYCDGECKWTVTKQKK